MNKNLAGALAIVFLGLIAVCAYKFVLSPMLLKKEQTEEVKKQSAASDAKVALTVRLAGDGYLGYFFATSPEMKRQAAKRGIGINFNDDKGAYAERLDKFARGEYDAIMLPVNSYLQHGANHNFPGVIVAAICDSKGADAVLAFDSKVPSGKVGDLNDASLNIVYTADSPSSFLLDLAIVDFDLFNLRNADTWRKEVGGSTEAFEKARRREGDVFVMWEPEVSRALREVPGLKQIWGSDRFSGYIVDVIVFRRDFLQSKQKDVVAFMEAYFSAMRSYKSDRDRLITDMRASTGLRAEEVEASLKKIVWHDLQSNATRQFGLNNGTENGATEGLVNTIIACTNVLTSTQRLKGGALDDPYKIINSGVLTQVQTRLPAELGKGAGKRNFRELTEEEWKKLPEIGVMRVEPIGFKQGSAEVDDPAGLQVDKVAELLVNNYPDARIIIRGHTATSSDEAEAVLLSQERADAVAQRLIAVHGISAHRLRTEGKGSSQPPARKPNENTREYRYRIPRVEFVLFADDNAF